MSLKTNRNRNLLLTSSAILAMANMLYAPMANAIVPNDNNTPDDIVDDEGGVNGVGMFFRADGAVCSGSLINARTVLFAAHCVNDVPAGEFGSSIPAAWSFNVDALPGLQTWFGNGFQSDAAANVFNVNQIWWNPDSVANPQGAGFLEGDIALASLDIPAANIPTWALLFSRLPDPAELDPESGTGYHVNITGYGNTGSGTFGDNVGLDFRRRAAENMLGALTSFDDRNTFLFGDPFGDLPQNLYRLDFDDPNQTNPFDFNLYLDEPLANEGTTAGGDSGGPLILDAANNSLSSEDLVIGVLSGGSRFFGPQGFSSYGTESFYQPLYLFYEYIAANNPYRYVSAIEGDGAWEDASHWQTDLDPNYRIIDADGNVVNGFPDAQQFGIEVDDDPGFGAVCFDLQGDNAGDACQDLSNGEFFAGPRDGSDAEVEVTVSDNRGTVSVEELNGLGLDTSGGALSELGGIILGGQSQSQNNNGVDFVENESQAGGDPLPAATIDNGLAGATDFVPNNIDLGLGDLGVRRYFDVTLANSGTTTLSSEVTIDRLAVAGAAGLAIGSAASLTSLIDIEQTGGRIAVDGALNSAGDYTIFLGMLSGTGTVTAPFVTSVAGSIAPGSLGTLGTLTIDGSAVLSSGNGLFIDLGTNGVNDVLAITGDASIGGDVIFNPTTDLLAGNAYTFLTLLGTDAETEEGTTTTFGTFSGEFANATTQLTPLLRAVLSYDETSVTATIEAGSFSDVITSTNAVQQSYANLLDGGRGAASLAPIFATLDLSTEEGIQGVLDSWAPVAETTVRALAKTSTEQTKRFHRGRMDAMASGGWGGKLTMMGAPIQMASNAQYTNAMSDIGYLQADNGENVQTTANIPSDYEAYLSGAFIDGSGSAMPTGQDFGEEDFDGFAINGGLEKLVNKKVSVGVSLSYTDLDAEVSLGQVAETEHLASTLYGQIRSDHNVNIDAQLSYGTFNSKTARTVAFPSNATLTTDDDSDAFGGELRVSKIFELGEAQIVPRASLTYTSIDFETLDEAGGLPGLTIDRNDITSTQGRVGLAIKSAASAKVRLTAHADFVNELGNVDDSFEANFVGLTTPTSSFAVFGSDESWGEIGASLAFEVDAMTVNVSADTTIARKDIEARTVRAGLSWKF